MSVSISMLIGGMLVILGTLLVLVSWLEIDNTTLASVSVIYVTGFFSLIVGLLFAFMRSIAKKQI